MDGRMISIKDWKCQYGCEITNGIDEARKKIMLALKDGGYAEFKERLFNNRRLDIFAR